LIDLSPLISAISVILGVLTYFLTMVHKAIDEAVKPDIPDAAQKENRRLFRKGLAISLVAGPLPLAVGFGFLFYLALPTAAQIVRTSSFVLWDFDLRRTLFVYLELAVFVCLAICLLSLSRLIKKLWNSRKNAG
jgi:hypothetical protein